MNKSKVPIKRVFLKPQKDWKWSITAILWLAINIISSCSGDRFKSWMGLIWHPGHSLPIPGLMDLSPSLHKNTIPAAVNALNSTALFYTGFFFNICVCMYSSSTPQWTALWNRRSRPQSRRVATACHDAATPSPPQRSTPTSATTASSKPSARAISPKWSWHDTSWLDGR